MYVLVYIGVCSNIKFWELVLGFVHPNMGHFHTWAKSCDHEIVRAQKKVSKGYPNTPPKPCSVVMDPQV